MIEKEGAKSGASVSGIVNAELDKWEHSFPIFGFITGKGSEDFFNYFVYTFSLTIGFRVIGSREGVSDVHRFAPGFEEV